MKLCQILTSLSLSPPAPCFPQMHRMADAQLLEIGPYGVSIDVGDHLEYWNYVAKKLDESPIEVTWKELLFSQKQITSMLPQVLESPGLETAKSISWRYLKNLLDKVNELLEATLLATPPPDDAAMLPLQEEPEMLPLQVPEKPQIVDAIAENPVEVTKAFDAASKFLAQQEKSQAQKRK